MKSISSLVLLVILALVFAPSSDLYAKGKKVKTEPPHIESVTADSITVKNGHESRTYKITSGTTIELNGNRVTPIALKSGMQVVVTPGCDDTVASSIAAGNVQ